MLTCGDNFFCFFEGGGGRWLLILMTPRNAACTLVNPFETSMGHSIEGNNIVGDQVTATASAIGQHDSSAAPTAGEEDASTIVLGYNARRMYRCDTLAA